VHLGRRRQAFSNQFLTALDRDFVRPRVPRGLFCFFTPQVTGGRHRGTGNQASPSSRSPRKEKQARVKPSDDGGSRQPAHHTGEDQVTVVPGSRTRSREWRGAGWRRTRLAPGGRQSSQRFYGVAGRGRAPGQQTWLLDVSIFRHNYRYKGGLWHGVKWPTAELWPPEGPSAPGAGLVRQWEAQIAEQRFGNAPKYSTRLICTRWPPPTTDLPCLGYLLE
jgi:hypothetical protein